MTQPAVREAVYPGSQAVQVPYKAVSVISVDKARRKCLVRDAFGVMMEIRVDVMRAKGNLPEPGEQWIIDRQYNDWIFGAIMTGGTEGVTVPQENVHGLPEIITAYDERMTGIADDAQAQNTATNASLATTNTNLASLESRTLGRLLAKGDIMAATASGVVDHRPVGADGQYLVADSTQATGLAYRPGLTLSAPLTGAVAAVRYVGGTTAGAPASGTFLTGDWITTQSGFQWICTAGGTPGTWRSTANEGLTRATALETRATLNETPGKNMFYGSGSVNPNNTFIKATGYTNWVNQGGITRSGGDFSWTKAGKWSIGFQADSDGVDFGIFHSYLSFGTPNPLGFGPIYLIQRNYRGTGFAGAGNMCQTASWTGWVESNALNIPWNLGFVWNAPAPASASSVSYRVWAEYLGPF